MNTEAKDWIDTKCSPRRLFELMAGKNSSTELPDEYYDSVIHSPNPVKSEKKSSENKVNPIKILMIGVGDCGVGILDNYSVHQNAYVSLLGIYEKGLFPDRTLDYEIMQIDGDPDALEDGRSGSLNPENMERLKSRMSNSDMIIIISCLEDKKAFVVANSIAELSREMDILTGGIIIPFLYGKDHKRQDTSIEIQKMKEIVDYSIIIRSDSFLKNHSNDNTANSVINTIASFIGDIVDMLSDMVNITSFINIDFEDIKMILGNGGKTFVGIGKGEGARKAEAATKTASSMDYTEGIVGGVKKELLYISGNISIRDIEKVTDYISSLNKEEPETVVAVRQDDELKDCITVMIIACGL